MRYAVRNTVILGVLWLLMVIAGVLYERHRAKELLRLRQRENQVKAKLEEVSGYLAIYEGVEKKLRQLQGRWQNRPKVLMAQDSPGRTFAYLNDILDVPEAFVTFDFTFIGRVDSTQYSHNSYALKGDGDFRNLVNFVWYIEHSQPFYAISNLELHENTGAETPDEEHNRDWVHFDLTLRAYFSPNSQIQDTLFVQNLTPPSPTFNPFRPLIYEALPLNKKGLFEVEGARLRGVGYRKAFLADKSGKLHILREGDPVFLGVLSRVDQARNYVEFLLDKGGITEKVVLEVQLQGEKE